MLRLSAPQNIFLNGLNTKFRSYVGGFGCVSPDTQIYTEHGLMPVSSIDRPMRVLSWNEKDQQFQLSLSGGAFPKGKANLYRVVTQQGEFVASGHHRSLCADGSYRRVDSLSSGDELSSFYPLQHETNQEFDLKSLPLGAQHCSKTLEGLMGGYADEARQYGLQLLLQEGFDLDFSLRQGGAHKSDRSFLMSDHQDIEPARTRQDQQTFRHSMMDCTRQPERHACALEGQKPSSPSEHTLGYPQERPLSPLMSKSHHTLRPHSSACHSFSNSCIKSTTILSVERLDVEQSYWDMQVLDTNNYVTSDGCIHHNSGKTFVGCLDLLIFFSRHPGTRQGYFGPSYPSIRDIFYPTFEEAAEMMGFNIVIREANKEVHVYRNGFYYGTVICRSMDRPDSIVGFKISRALCDEIDTLSAEKAEKVWNKIIARMRLVIPGIENSIGVTTTPEGFRMVYQKFKKNPTESYSMVQASTYENELYLPPDYISSLRESYDSNLIDAYIEGEFVNLSSGTVYHKYDRTLNATNRVWDGKEALHIGSDFNVGRMCSVAHVIDNNDPAAVDEITGGYDTPDMIRMIKQRYWKEVSEGEFVKTCEIYIYPDSSGKNRKSVGASKTDISLMEKAGFKMKYNSANPPVKDRVNAMNAMFCNANGERRYKVNQSKCPEYSEKLEQQVYKNDEPEKDGTEDVNDAGGYFIAYRYPIIKPVSRIKVTF